MSVPDWSMSAISASYSAWEPSHQCTASGLASAAASATQAFSASSLLDIMRLLDFGWRKNETVVCGGGHCKVASSRPALAPRATRLHCRAGDDSLRGENGEHMRYVGVEFVVAQAWQAQGEIELQETDVGCVGQAGAVQCRRWREARFTIDGGQELHAPFRGPRHHGHDVRVVQGLEQGGIHAVGLQLVGDAAEECRQALPRIGNAFDGN